VRIGWFLVTVRIIPEEKYKSTILSAFLNCFILIISLSLYCYDSSSYAFTYVPTNNYSIGNSVLSINFIGVPA